MDRFIYFDQTSIPLITLIPLFLVVVNYQSLLLIACGITFVILCFVLFSIKAWVVGKMINPALIPFKIYLVRGSNALITGGTSGLGKELARELLRLEFGEIIIGCRDMKKAELMKAEFSREFAGTDIGKNLDNSLFFYELDLGNFESIRNFGIKVSKRHWNLRFIVNNAGVCGASGTTKEGFEKHFGVNYLGHCYLLNILKNIITRSNSFIINVSSFNHQFAKRISFEDIKTPCDHIYRQARYNFSKYCMELYTMMYHFEVRKKLFSNSKMVSMCPGVVRTNISRYYLCNFWLLKLVYHCLGYLFTKSSYEGIQTILFIVLFNKVIKPGKYYKNCTLKSRGKNCRDIDYAEELWKWTGEYIENYEKNRRKKSVGSKDSV